MRKILAVILTCLTLGAFGPVPTGEAIAAGGPCAAVLGVPSIMGTGDTLSVVSGPSITAMSADIELGNQESAILQGRRTNGGFEFKLPAALQETTALQLQFKFTDGLRQCAGTISPFITIITDQPLKASLRGAGSKEILQAALTNLSHVVAATTPASAEVDEAAACAEWFTGTTPCAVLDAYRAISQAEDRRSAADLPIGTPDSVTALSLDENAAGTVRLMETNPARAFAGIAQLKRCKSIILDNDDPDRFYQGDFYEQEPGFLTAQTFGVATAGPGYHRNSINLKTDILGGGRVDFTTRASGSVGYQAKAFYLDKEHADVPVTLQARLGYKAVGTGTAGTTGTFPNPLPLFDGYAKSRFILGSGVTNFTKNVTKLTEILHDQYLDYNSSLVVDPFFLDARDYTPSGAVSLPEISLKDGDVLAWYMKGQARSHIKAFGAGFAVAGTTFTSAEEEGGVEALDLTLSISDPAEAYFVSDRCG